MAETRASELTFNNFKTNVLSTLNADLAVCVSNTTSPEDPFMQAARYKWLYPEPKDWADAFDYACQCHGCWRELLKIKDQWLGGILDPKEQHPGSAAILTFYRWFLRMKLFESGALSQYDYFIVTRSDYYYLAPFPRLPARMNANHIWVPEGEDYSGLTDRMIVVPRKHVHAALSLMDPIIENSTALFQTMSHAGDWNLEKYIRFTFERKGIWRYVRRFPRTMFAVRNHNTSTRWGHGQWLEEVGMIVKYDTEYNLAKASKPWKQLY